MYLHRMNPVRMEFVREKIQMGRVDDKGWTFEDRGKVDADIKKEGTGRWLQGMDVLDVGCGGGLLTEVREWSLSFAIACWSRNTVSLSNAL